MDTLLARLDDVERVFRQVDDRLGMARVELGRAWIAWVACRADVAHAAFRRAWDGFQALGYTALQDELFEMIMASSVFAGNSIAQHRQIHRQLASRLRPDAGPMLRAAAELTAARTEYLGGELPYADLEAATMRTADLLRQTGSELGYWGAFGFLSFAAEVEGRLDESERLDRLRAEGLAAIGDRKVLANVLGTWAIALARLGDPQQALARVAQAREIVREEDLADRIVIDLGEAMARAVVGDFPAAHEAIARARRVAAGVVMAPLTTQLDQVDGLVRLAEGDAPGAREIGLRLVAELEGRGLMAVARIHRRDLVEPAERMLAGA